MYQSPLPGGGGKSQRWVTRLWLCIYFSLRRVERGEWGSQAWILESVNTITNPHTCLYLNNLCRRKYKGQRYVTVVYTSDANIRCIQSESRRAHIPKSEKSSCSSSNRACLPGRPEVEKKALLALPAGSDSSSRATELPAGAFSFSNENIPILFAGMRFFYIFKAHLIQPRDIPTAFI
jgi:hypothetical protein